MKFCPVVPEICREQVHVPQKERRRKRRKRRKRRIIIIRNGAKTISLKTLFGRLNYLICRFLGLSSCFIVRFLYSTVSCNIPN